jgi:hypothetical protein
VSSEIFYRNVDQNPIFKNARPDYLFFHVFSSIGDIFFSKILISIIVHCHMSTRSPYSLMKIYKHFVKDFELEKNKKKLLPSMKL